MDGYQGLGLPPKLFGTMKIRPLCCTDVPAGFQAFSLKYTRIIIVTFGWWPQQTACRALDTEPNAFF